MSCERSFSFEITTVCNSNITFTENGNDPIGFKTPIVVGETIDFLNTTVGSVSQEWFLDGQLVSTNINYGPSFNTVGVFFLQLKVDNGGCINTLEQILDVGNNCPGSTGNENNIWYFGIGLSSMNAAGFDFNTGKPEILTDANPNFNGFEPMTTISNGKGELLMYTEGVNLYDSEHNIVNPGTPLLTSGSSTNGVMILNDPDPNFSNRYYIFTVDGIESTNNAGFNYSIVEVGVDKSINIIQMNIPVYAPAAEKMTAVPSPENDGIWIVTHEINTTNFRSYLLKGGNDGLVDDGVLSPMISTIGKAEYTLSFFSSAVGHMKASPIGDRIACIYYDFDAEPGLEVFDFDRITGELTNLAYSFDIATMYSLEFSPDGSKLYFGGSNKPLYQLDLEDLSTDPIAISTVSNVYPLQVAPNGKIYFAKGTISNEIGVINFPNLRADLINIEDEIIQLPGNRRVRFSFPTFYQNYFEKEIEINVPSCVLPNVGNISATTDVVPLGNEELIWTIEQGQPQIAEIQSTTPDGTQTFINVFAEGVINVRLDYLSPCGNVTERKEILVDESCEISDCPDFKLKVTAPKYVLKGNSEISSLIFKQIMK